MPVGPRRAGCWIGRQVRDRCRVSAGCWTLVAMLGCTLTPVCGGDAPQGGDEIKLRRGGAFQAEVIRTPEQNGGRYELRLENGAVIEIDQREVDSVVAPQSVESDYQAELKRHDLTTADGHMAMAEWCQVNRLRIQKVKHLRKVIEIDPEHEHARRLLGYTRHIVSGKWVLRDEYFQSIGYVRDGAAMRLPVAQQVEEQERAHREAVNEWKGKIPRWIKLLENERRFAEARTELESIDDVKAIPVLVDAYQRLSGSKRPVEYHRDVKSLLIGIVSQFDILSARLFLVELALNEPDDVLREEAARILKQKHATWTADYLISRLKRIPPSADGMIHDREAIAVRDFISRAATMLESLETDVSEAILPLINLIYINRVLVPVAAPQRGGLGGASFGSDGSIGMSQGSPKPQPRPVNIRIEPARVALIKLTDQRFDYDKQAWLDWYLSQTLPAKIDLRRLD